MLVLDRITIDPATECVGVYLGSYGLAHSRVRNCALDRPLLRNKTDYRAWVDLTSLRLALWTCLTARCHAVVLHHSQLATWSDCQGAAEKRNSAFCTTSKTGRKPRQHLAINQSFEAMRTSAPKIQLHSTFKQNKGCTFAAQAYSKSRRQATRHNSSTR